MPAMNHGFLQHWFGLPVAALLAVGTLLGSAGCKCEPQAAGPAASASSGGLAPEVAGKVLAEVGEKKITLGDYVAALDRMDRFERVRYQTPESRKALLQEMINAELLAAEARRRGLDREPEVRARLHQALRDALLEEVRARLPGPEEIPEKEVRVYYDRHRADFFTPERRRLSVIITRERERAAEALQQAQGSDAQVWGRLVEQYSVRPDGKQDGDAGLRGDLGFMGREAASADKEVPAAVRSAGFAIEEQGKVFDRVVEVEGSYYVVRLVAKNEAGQRTFAESERSIRVTLAQRALRQAEQKLEAELRKKYPVEIDEEALQEVRAPTGEK